LGWGQRGWEPRRIGGGRGTADREAREKCGALIFLIQQCIRVLSKTRTQSIFDLHLKSSQSLLRLLSNYDQAKICAWAEKHAYFH